jgi:hypothetical protein
MSPARSALAAVLRFILRRIVRPLSIKIPVIAPHGIFFALDVVLLVLIGVLTGHFVRKPRQ